MNTIKPCGLYQGRGSRANNMPPGRIAESENYNHLDNPERRNSSGERQQFSYYLRSRT